MKSRDDLVKVQPKSGAGVLKIRCGAGQWDLEEGATAELPRAVYEAFAPRLDLDAPRRPRPAAPPREELED